MGEAAHNGSKFADCGSTLMEDGEGSGKGSIKIRLSSIQSWKNSTFQHLPNYILSRVLIMGEGGAVAHSGSKFADLDSLLMGTGEGMDGSNVKLVSIN